MQSTILIAVCLGYLVIVATVAVLFRNHETVDDFLIANRSAGALQVSQGLFTLIGGGEFVTMATLGFVYGLNAVALFLGYGLAFFFLAMNATRLRHSSAEKKFVSLPDYVYHHFGPGPSFFAFAFSVAAFFALLMLQFSAAASVLTPITGVPYTAWLVLLTVAITSYLVIGGLRAVLTTDVLQGAAMLGLLPVLLWMLFATLGSEPSIAWFGTEPLSPAIFTSLTVTGFLVGSSSADVWQRAYAAQSDRAARRGFIWGGFLFLVYGLALAMLGIAAQHLGVTNADTAFVDLAVQHTSPVALIVVVLLLVAAISSTADTEIFLLASLFQRELPRVRLLDASHPLLSTLGGVRTLVVIVAVTAAVASIFFRDLVGIYSWLLSALLVISPIIVFSLFAKASSTGMFLSMLANAVLFAILIGLGYLTLDNAYLIAVPGLIFYLTAYLVRRRSPASAG